jgi:hypothetical protein
MNPHDSYSPHRGVHGCAAGDPAGRRLFTLFAGLLVAGGLTYPMPPQTNWEIAATSNTLVL